jgi:SAM-dependent methyltransferase
MNPSPILEQEFVQECPLCGSKDNRQFDDRIVKGVRVVNRLCGQCGLVFQSPRMTAGAIHAYYQTEYIRQHQGHDEVSEQELETQSARAEHLLTQLLSHGLKIKTHLDIGCSTGQLMAAVSGAYRCRSVGIEPAEIYRRYCHDRGLEVFESLEALAQIELGRFDLITMAHVLEHLPDASSYLKKLKREALSERGYLLVEVPNLFYHPSFELPHLTSYHRETLGFQLRSAGYQALWIHAHGLPRHRRIPLYLTALATPQSGVSSAELPLPRARGIRFRRAVGQAIYRLAPRIMKPLKTLRKSLTGGRA